MGHEKRHEASQHVFQHAPTTAGCGLAAHVGGLVISTSYGMKASGMRLFPNHAGAIVAVAYGNGVLLGCICLLWSWAAGLATPPLKWWQHILAPLAIGAAAFVLEAMGTSPLNGFTFEHPPSVLGLERGKTALVVLLVLLLVGWPVYQIAQQ